MFKKIGIALVFGGISGFVLEACTAVSPPPQCQVIATGDHAYMALFTNAKLESDAASCADVEEIKAMQIGIHEFLPPIKGDAKLGIRPQLQSDWAAGRAFSANIDPKNDCKAKTKCESCVLPGEISTDGGLKLSDGGLAIPVYADGGVALLDGGAFDVANPCQPVADPIPRVDESDPDGKGLISVGTFPRVPTNGVCASTMPDTVQNFAAVSEKLVSGETYTLPETKVSIRWSDFKVRVTSVTPGTVFSTKATVSVGACVRSYDVVAYYLEVACESDLDCKTEPDRDAGRVVGSGLTSEFYPVCNVDIGYCVPGTDPATGKPVDITKL
jgi:hypothetical protein